MTPNDPLPALIAGQINGIKRIDNGGPFLLFKADPSDDGRVIELTVTRYDFVGGGDRTVKLLLHLSPPLSVEAETQHLNGQADPVMNIPDDSGSAA